MTPDEQRAHLRQSIADFGLGVVARTWGLREEDLLRQANTDDPIDPRLLPWLGVTLVQTGTVDTTHLAVSTVKEEEKWRAEAGSG